MAAALGFMACSEEDISVADNGAEGDSPKGMVLRATVEQGDVTRATISDAWFFDFATDDVVSVTNTAISDYYTFTNGGTQFRSADAEPTDAAATWYAYFPSHEIDLTNQSGSKADVAGKYALAGATTEATTGEDGLSITLSPKVAILVIKNYKGAIDINVKNGEYTWVTGLRANDNAAGFTIATADTRQDLISVTETGTYYIAVPAGKQLAVKDGDKAIKSTGTFGLTAGRYYEVVIESAPGQGKAKATINDSQVDVNWVQLWKDGPKFAEYNVGVTDGKVESAGGYYEWADDIASTRWGSNWRMPTSAEYEALLDNCEVELVYSAEGEPGVESFLGARFRGKTGTAYAENSVYFPAAGQSIRGEIHYQGYSGIYWSATPYDSGQSYLMDFFSDILGPTVDGRTNPGVGYENRDGCWSVRAVLAE